MRPVVILLACVVTASCSSHDQLDVTAQAASAYHFPPPIVATGTIDPKTGLLTVPGSLEGVFSVTGDGAASYQIPLEVPAGRAGVQPALSLMYSNRAGNGLAGVGWSVTGLSQITRCGSTYHRDRVARPVDFVHDHYCLDGMRLVQIATTPVTETKCKLGTSHEYRTEPETQQRVVTCGEDGLGPIEWIVFEGSGRVAYYGGDATSRIEVTVRGLDASGNPTLLLDRRLTWLVGRVEDHGYNYMTITYGSARAIDQVEWWPARIDYTGSVAPGLRAPGLPPTRSVVFDYFTARGDAYSTYVGGIQLPHTQLLRTVTMTAPEAFEQVPALAYVRQYRLGYAMSVPTNRNLLTSISVCDGLGECMPATTLSYAQPTMGFAQTRQGTDAPAGSIRVFAADVNNDGRDDLYFVGGGFPSAAIDRVKLAGGTMTAPVFGAAVVSSAAIDNRLPMRQAYEATGDQRADMIAETCPQSAWQCPPGVADCVPDAMVCHTPSIAVFASAGDGTFSAAGGRSLCMSSGRCIAPDLVADFNGDLVPDTWSGFGYLLNIRSGTAKDLVTNPLGHDFAGGALYADVDGDGTLDMLWPRTSQYPQQFDAVHLRGVAGQETVEAEPTNFTRDVGNCDIFMDVNGDGLTDVVNVKNGALVRINRGGGRFDPPANWGATWTGTPVCATQVQLGNPFLGYRSAGVYPIDINNDGRQDLLVMQPDQNNPNLTQAFVLISAGSGFGIQLLDMPFVVDGHTCVFNGGAPSATPLDANGDGLVDFAITCGPEWILYTQTRSLGTTSSATPPDVLVAIRDGRKALVRRVDYKVTTDPTVYTATTSWAQPMLVVSNEWSDDGAGNPVELARHSYAGGTLTGGPEGWLGFTSHTIVDPRSQSTHVTTYATTGNLPSGEPAARSIGGYLGGRAFHPFKGQVVDDTTTVKVNTATSSTTLKTETTRIPTAAEVVYPSGVHNYLVYTREVTTASYEDATRLSDTATDFTVDTCGNQVRVVVDRDVGAAVARRTTTDTTYQSPSAIATPGSANPPCNLGTSWLAFKTDEKVTSTVGTMSQIRETQWLPEADGTGRLRDTIIQPNGPAAEQLCTRVFHRDPVGNPDIIDVTPGNTCTRVSQNPVGQPSRPTKELTRTTRAIFNSNGASYEGIFVIFEKDALGHDTYHFVHPGLGVSYGTTDANAQTEARQFDGFGRPVRVDRPDGSNAWPSTIHAQTSYNLPTTSLASAICLTDGYTGTTLSELEYTTGTDGAISFVCRDRLDRPARTGRNVPSGGNTGASALSYTDTLYDPMFPDRVYTVYRPHFANTTRSVAAINYYDAAGRVGITATTKPDDASQVVFTTITHTGLTVDTCEALRIPRRKVFTSYGTIESTSVFPGATSCAGGTPATTTFAYGPFDTQTAVTDAAGNVVTQTFDGLGRRVKVVDADIGTVSDTYTSFGTIDAETNGSGTTSFEYDLLGRLTRRTASDGVDSFTWDPAGAIGKLASSRRAAAHTVDRSYTYDSLTRVRSGAVQIDTGPVLDTLVDYEPQGRVGMKHSASLVGLGRIRTHEVYTGAWLTAVEIGRESATCTTTSQCQTGETCMSSLGNVCGRPVWTLGAADPEGRSTRETTGDGAVTTHDYHGGYLGGYTATLGTAILQQESYSYVDQGSLGKRTDVRLGASESFGYDGADRLTSTQIAGQPAQTYRYDAIGNMTYASDVPQVGCSGADFQYDRASPYGQFGPHVLTSITTCNTSHPYFKYDAVGNQINGTDTRDIFSWTSFGKLATSANALVSFSFDYDAEHHLVEKRRTAGLDPYHLWDTIIHADDLERRILTAGGGEDDVLTIAAGGSTLELEWSWNGTSGGQTLRYLHPDRLGSPVLITDAAGTVVERQSFDAWGTMRGADMVGTHPWPFLSQASFTGHEYATGTWIGDGVYFVDMGGRLYQPLLKRFWSPDPIVQAPFYGPSWNRYSYTFNNPLRFTDPSGYLAADTTLAAFFESGRDWTGFAIIEADAAAFDQRWDERQQQLADEEAVARSANQPGQTQAGDGRLQAQSIALDRSVARDGTGAPIQLAQAAPEPPSRWCPEGATCTSEERWGEGTPQTLSDGTLDYGLGNRSVWNNTTSSDGVDTQHLARTSSTFGCDGSGPCDGTITSSLVQGHGGWGFAIGLDFTSDGVTHHIQTSLGGSPNSGVEGGTYSSLSLSPFPGTVLSVAQGWFDLRTRSGTPLLNVDLRGCEFCTPLRLGGLDLFGGH